MFDELTQQPRYSPFAVPLTMINAAGAWGDKIAALIGDNIPLQAKAFMLMITERVRAFGGPALVRCSIRFLIHS